MFFEEEQLILSNSSFSTPSHMLHINFIHNFMTIILEHFRIDCLPKFD